MILPKKIRATILNKKWLNEKVVQLDLRHNNDEGMEFLPGQFVSLQVDDSRYRAYSICSDYKNREVITLIIEAGHDGIGAKYARNIEVGHEVVFIGPSGRFFLRNELPSKLFFLATGTGIAPFVPMFHKLEDIQYTGAIQLRFGVRFIKDLMLLEILEDFKRRLNSFNYDIYISKEIHDFHKNGRVTHQINEILDNKAMYYICGNPNMVDETVEFLSSNGINDENIIIEGFTHAKN